MGSFHLTCAVSNTPITNNDRAVMLGLDITKPELSIWPRGTQITSLPIRGVYNSYGAIDIDPGQDERVAMFLANTPLDCDEDRYNLYGGKDDPPINSNTHAFMLIHERVYDYLLTEPFREEWEETRIGRRRDEFDVFVEELKADPDNVFLKFRLDQAWRETFMIRGESLGFEHACWNQYVGDVAMGEAYWREVGAVIRNTFSLGYRIAPSMYASETLCILERDGLNAILKEIRDEEAAERAEWDTDD